MCTLIYVSCWPCICFAVNSSSVWSCATRCYGRARWRASLGWPTWRRPTRSGPPGGRSAPSPRRWDRERGDQYRLHSPCRHYLNPGAALCGVLVFVFVISAIGFGVWPLFYFYSQLKRALLFICTLTKKTNFNELYGDIFSYVKDRYFKGEALLMKKGSQW